MIRVSKVTSVTEKCRKSKFGHVADWMGPFGTLVQFLLLGLAVLSISRIGLIVWQWKRVEATGIVADILIQGARADLILLGYFLVIPLMLAPLLAHGFSANLWRRCTMVWTFCALIFIVFMELATPQFIMQFDVRPNRLFIEYLSYPNEVIATLWNGFRIAVVLGMTGTIALSVLLFRVLRSTSNHLTMWSSKKVLLIWPILFVLVFFQIRSTTAHRPANTALFALTSDAMVNSLIINSPWSVLDALYGMGKEASSSEIYGSIAYSTQTGHLFRRKLDSHSSANWTPIPCQTGHLFHAKRDTLGVTRRGVEVWFYSGPVELVKFARFFRNESPFKLS